MAIILFECSSSTVANQIVADVEAGELFGVDMGTTSKAVSYSKSTLVDCTKSRSEDLIGLTPENAQPSLWDSEPASFSDADVSGKSWYLRGKL
jgi:hypothetical protein